MANIWRNISGRLGARLGARSYISTSRRALDPASDKLTFVQGVCVTVVTAYTGGALLNYWLGLDRIRARMEALDMERERTGREASNASD